MMEHFKKILRGLFWMGGLQGIIRLITFARLAVLARLLTPFEFGLFGIASLVLALLETLTDAGVNVFFIQKEGKLKDYLDTAWVVSIIRGIFIFLVLYLGSNAIAYFFHSTTSSNLIKLIALASLLRGFINPSIVRFQKELKFHKEFVLRAASVFVDVITSIIVAIITRSAIALVWGMIASVLVEVTISHLFITPRPSLKIDFSKFKKLIHRGKWITLASIFQYLFANGDNITIGRLMNTYALGLYQMAYRISTIPITEISDVASRVNFAVYSQIYNDKEKLKEAYIKTILLIFFLVVPIGSVIFFLTRQVVLLIAGSNWLVIVPVLKVLSIFGVLRALEGSVTPLFLSQKKQEYVSAMNLLSIFGMGVTIIPLVSHFGILGASYAVLIGTLFSIPLALYYLFKIFKY